MSADKSADNEQLTPVGSLVDRYKLTKSVIYKRMKDLDVSTQKIGVKAYISPTQLNLLDALHEFIQGGGNTAEFIYFRGLDEHDAV